MKNRYFFWIFLLGILILLTHCTESGNTTETKEPLSRPNIIFIMTDDHAYQAISCFGSELIETPNIDRIAAEGVLFKNSFVTNSICAPSRAVLLTGQYSHRNGLRDNRDVFDGSQMTFPKLLQEAGYSTAIVGKWHLKTAPTGFDYWNVLIGQGQYYNPVMIENGDTSNHIGYTTDLITDFTLDYLDNRNTDKPFCVLYHHKAPHRNWMPKLEDLPEVLSKEYPLPPTFYDDYSTRTAAASEQDMRIEDMYMSMDMKLLPEDYGVETGSGGNAQFSKMVEKNWMETILGRFTPEQREAWDEYYDPIRKDFRERNLQGKELLEWKYQRYMQDYLGSVKAVDDNIGRLLAYLDENNLTENTVIVYTSDQGFYLGEHGWYDKRFMYEESLRMPLVMRYPAGVNGGQKIEDMVLNLDFAPTILDYAGVQVPEQMQGASFRPLVEGQQPDDWRQAMYYHYYEYPHGWHDVKKHEGVRTHQHKLIHFYDDIDAWELYDLDKDSLEVNNVIDDPAYAPVVEDLKAQLQQFREQYGLPENEVAPCIY